MKAPQAHTRSRRASQSGQSLAVAMVALAFLTTLSGTVTVALMIEAQTATRQQNVVAAYYAARAGCETACLQVLGDSAAVDSLADPWADNEKAFKSIDVKDGRKCDVSYRDETTGAPRWGIVDEARKLNVNAATAEMLARLHPAFTREISAAVVAQREKKKFAALPELTLVQGIDRDFLTAPRDGAPAGLASLLTVYGDGRVNINTAPEAVLGAVGFEKNLAQKIVEARAKASGALKSVAEAATLAGLSALPAEALPRLGVSSEYFTITATGKSGLGRAAATSVVREVVRRDAGRLVVVSIDQLR